MDISKDDVSRDLNGILDAMTDGERLRFSIDVEREMGKRSTFYLARHILGYDKISPRFHRALCRHYDKYIYDLQLQLHPRKHYKTTLITIAGKIRLVLLDPDITICIIANTLHNSQTFLREIRNHFIGNDKFRSLYPEHAVVSKRGEGKIDRFTTPARKDFKERIETFEAASADRAIVSRHYKLMNFDDFVDDKNTATSELNEKLYENYATSLSVTSLTKEGRPWHHIVGTRWNFDDPYQRILDENERTGHFKTLITQIYWSTEDKDGKKETHYLFPEQFPKEAIDYLRRTQGNQRFSCLYLNNPVPEGDTLFNPNQLKTFRSEDRKTATRNRIITIDPASSIKSRKADPSVIAAYEMDGDRNIYILDIQRGWWNPDELIERTIGLHKLHNINKIGVESVVFSDWMCYYLEKERKENGYHFQVIPIKRSHTKTKEQRLENIQPYLNEGKIHVRHDEPEHAQLCRELREYPFGRYDDILDTLSDAIRMLKIPAKKRGKRPSWRVPPVTLSRHQHFQTGRTYRSC